MTKSKLYLSITLILLAPLVFYWGALFANDIIVANAQKKFDKLIAEDRARSERCYQQQKLEGNLNTDYDVCRTWFFGFEPRGNIFSIIGQDVPQSDVPRMLRYFSLFLFAISVMAVIALVRRVRFNRKEKQK